MFSTVIKELINALLSMRIERPKYKLSLEDYDIKGLIKEVGIHKLERPSRLLKVGAIDAASVNIHVGFSELAIAAVSYVGHKLFIALPSYKNINVSSDIPPIISSYISLNNVKWVTNKYVKIGTKYLDDPELPEGALAHDIRISLESYMIKELANFADADVVIIDGPIEYPLKHPVEESRWNREVKLLNEERVKSIRGLVERGVIPVSIVKRISGSRYLVRNPKEAINDALVITKIIDNIDKPSYLGPIITRGRYSNMTRYLYYIVIPIKTHLTSYSLFRVELPKEAIESFSTEYISNILSYLAYNSLGYGLSLPYKLVQADRASKRIVSMISSLTEGILRLKGITLIQGGMLYE